MSEIGKIILLKYNGKFGTFFRPLVHFTQGNSVLQKKTKHAKTQKH